MEAREVAARIADGGPVRMSAGSYMVKCPAHADDTASLSISTGSTQPVVLHCHANCDTTDILAAVNLTWAEVCEPLVPTASGHRVSDSGQTIYSYRDAQGVEVFQVVRSVDDRGKKKFLQRHGRPGAWVWNLQGIERVLYRLPEVIAAVEQGEDIWIPEGEKDVEALVNAGVCATTNSGGAGRWREEYATVLAGARCTVVADPDETGRAHARQIRDSIIRAGGDARIVEASAGKDAYDHLAAGKGLDDFRETAPFQAPRIITRGMDIDDYLNQTLPEQKFILPDTLAESEVWMVTGFEGHGKSLLLKQVAVQCALGYHPFTGAKVTPRNVLVIDVENATRDNFADMMMLRHRASHYGDWAKRGRLVIEEPGIIDLFQPAWQAWLMERVTAEKPDLIVVGPIYKMVGKDLREEDSARQLMKVLAEAQSINNSALILEHHVPKANNGERHLDPLGSGLLLRWCNFITGLRPIDLSSQGIKQDVGIYALEHQRKGRRRGRRWTTHLRWGRGIEWPWEPLEEAGLKMEVEDFLQNYARQNTPQGY